MMEAVEKSAKSYVRKKLKRMFNIYFTKRDFYAAVCSYNDHMGSIGDFTDMVTLLNTRNSELKNFVDYLLEQYEPRIA